MQYANIPTAEKKRRKNSSSEKHSLPSDILEGWGEISAFLKWSKKKALRYRLEWAALGVIWYELRGRPPTRRVRSFKFLLMLWIMKKGQRGEMP